MHAFCESLLRAQKCMVNTLVLYRPVPTFVQVTVMEPPLEFLPAVGAAPLVLQRLVLRREAEAAAAAQSVVNVAYWLLTVRPGAARYVYVRSNFSLAVFL